MLGTTRILSRASLTNAGPLAFRVHPSIHGWEWPHGPVPDEPDDGFGRVSVDDSATHMRLGGNGPVAVGAPTNMVFIPPRTFPDG
jgi:hypothetical protein